MRPSDLTAERMNSAELLATIDRMRAGTRELDRLLRAELRLDGRQCRHLARFLVFGAGSQIVVLLAPTAGASARDEAAACA